MSADFKKVMEEGIPFVERTGVKVLTMERGHVKMLMPFEPNVNHVGTMYAGALFTLAELPGGAMFLSSFDAKRFYPIVKDVQIRFRRPATTDITVEVRLSAEEIRDIESRAAADGKADFDWECELLDAEGTVVAIAKNQYQMRSHG